MRRKQILIVLLMVVALALRVWYLRINPLSPLFSNADDGDYYRRALRLAVTGLYVDDAWLIRPPFHVFVFAAFLRLAIAAGRSPAFGVTLIQAFQAGLGVLCVPLCYKLAERLFDARAGLIFAAFWAIWFPFVELPATLFSEPIYLFLFALHLWLLLRYDDMGRARDMAAAGLVLGLAALTRSPALYALVFAVPWLGWRSWKRAGGRVAPALRAALPPFALLVATTLVVVLPWTARNWIVYHHIIPVDTLGPINLWLDLGSPGERDAKIQALQAVPQADRQALATREARKILAADPLRPFRQMWPTFRHIWKAQYVEDYFVKRGFFTRPLREAAPLGLFGDLLWIVFTFTGIAAFLHPRTDRPFKIVTSLWLVYSIMTVLIFHVEPRYLLPIWFLLGLYASALLSQPAQFVRDLRRHVPRGLTIGVATIMLAVLFVQYRDYPAILRRGFAREAAMRAGDAAYARANYAAAEQAYRESLRVDPGFADAEVALGLALGAQGKAAQGIPLVPPQNSRRSALVAGALRRAIGDIDGARRYLQPAEGRSGEDTQAWSMEMLRPEARSSLVIGDDALDLGYLRGFGMSERVGDIPMRWLLGDGAVHLPLDQPIVAGDSIMLDIAAPLPIGGPVEITIAGRWRTSFMPRPVWRRYRFSLPQELVGSTDLRIDFHAPTRLPMRDDPKSDDARPLSVMLHRVAVE